MEDNKKKNAEHANAKKSNTEFADEINMKNAKNSNSANNSK